MKSCLALVFLTFLILTFGSVAGIYLTVRELNTDAVMVESEEEKMPLSPVNETTAEPTTTLEVSSE